MHLALLQSLLSEESEQGRRAKERSQVLMLLLAVSVCFDTEAAETSVQLVAMAPCVSFAARARMVERVTTSRECAPALPGGW